MLNTIFKLRINLLVPNHAFQVGAIDSSPEFRLGIRLNAKMNPCKLNLNQWGNGDWKRHSFCLFSLMICVTCTICKTERGREGERERGREGEIGREREEESCMSFDNDNDEFCQLVNTL